MAIQSGDIVFLKSQVMDDVPEGGGAPTSNKIDDGKSNEILTDVTEVDRAGGKVKTRKIFLGVLTDDVERYMDANVILERPPVDPNISVCLMTTGETFDRRTEILSRMESYFAPGTVYSGWLFGNHLRGQMTVAVAQRVGTEVPILGKTLVLRKFEGLATELDQFIRVQSVETEVRDFVDGMGVSYQLLIVSLGLAGPLSADFPGFDPSRVDPTFAAQRERTTVRDSTVADATRYFGVKALEAAAHIGDYTVQVGNIYHQLVPSAQIESPIADARTNQTALAYVAAGSSVVQTLTLAFTTSQAMFVGAAMVPGSLTIARGGITLTDAGGRLYNGSAEVGSIDYENGIAALSVNVFGSSGGSHTVTYTPAGVPESVTQSIGVRVTAESRSLTQVQQLPSIPARASLSVAYQVAGRWYVLREDGTGALRGSDVSHGVGMLNYSTGTVSVTFGALPDIGVVIYQWVEADTVSPYAAASLRYGGQAIIAINADGELSAEPGSKSFDVETLQITWVDGSTTRTVTCNAAGTLSGYGTGTATAGVIKLAPTTMPARDTVIKVESVKSMVGLPSPVTWGNSGGDRTTTLAAGVVPGSIRIPVKARLSMVQPLYQSLSGGGWARGRPDQFVPVPAEIRDNAAGEVYLYLSGLAIMVGAIDYGTGAFVMSNSVSTSDANILAVARASRTGWTKVVNYSPGTGAREAAGFGGYLGDGGVDVYYDLGSSLTVSEVPGYVYYSATTPDDDEDILVELSELRVATDLGANYQLRNVTFDMGGVHYTQMPDGELVRDISPTTGVGTQAGEVITGTGGIVITSWTGGQSPAVSGWRGAQVPPSEGLSSPYAAASVTFRTAAAPLRPLSVSVSGEMLDGTDFTVTVDANGKISGTRVKGRVSIDTGVIELYFVDPSNDDEDAPQVDLTHLGITGVTTMPMDLARTSTLRYNAVSYSFVPLEASVIGIDPVRLPTDGRVPIVRPGMFGVVGYTGTVNITELVDDDVIDCGYERLSRARIIDSDGQVIDASDVYDVDLEAGTVTVHDAAEISLPAQLEYRIEDMGLIADAQISGHVRFTRPLTHEFPLAGSYLSTALYLGTLYARVSHVFDQASWTGTWSDSPASSTLASYDDVGYPIVVTNRGAITERWALIFQSNGTQYQLIGEHVGNLGLFSKNEVADPHNAAAGAPYMSIAAGGWGSGWGPGNVLRINTVGAVTPFDVIQTIQQGPETGLEHNFRLLARGDIDRP